MGTIDRDRLAEMITANQSVTRMAEMFGVSKSAVSQAKKKLVGEKTKVAVLEKAHQYIQRDLNAIDQLQKVNEHANWMLDLLMRWQKGDPEALQVLESKIKRVKSKETGELTIKEIKFKDPRELALKTMAEIRGQLKLQLEIFQTLYDMKAVQEFQEAVLEAIGEVDKPTRERVLSNLRRRKALRRAAKFS